MSGDQRLLRHDANLDAVFVDEQGTGKGVDFFARDRPAIAGIVGQRVGPRFIFGAVGLQRFEEGLTPSFEFILRHAVANELLDPESIERS